MLTPISINFQGTEVLRGTKARARDKTSAIRERNQTNCLVLSLVLVPHLALQQQVARLIFVDA